MPSEVILGLVLVHAVVTWFMVGVIWFVQVVHYPLMGNVGEERFRLYALAHQRRTMWVVAPVMGVEAACAVLIAFDESGGTAELALKWTGAGLLAVIWLSTYAVQVPLHEQLAKGFTEAGWRRLLKTNWVRTIAWTLRGGVAAALVVGV